MAVIVLACIAAISFSLSTAERRPRILAASSAGGSVCNRARSISATAAKAPIQPHQKKDIERERNRRVRVVLFSIAFDRSHRSCRVSWRGSEKEGHRGSSSPSRQCSLCLRGPLPSREKNPALFAHPTRFLREEWTGFLFSSARDRSTNTSCAT